MHNLSTLADNLARIKEQITTNTPRIDSQRPRVELIAVSKGFPDKTIRELHSHGQLDFAENYASEFNQKVVLLQDLNINWHYIGKLQSNKIKYIAPFANWIHSVEKLSQVSEINKWALTATVHKNNHISSRKINTLIQININGTERQGGASINDVNYIIKLGHSINQQPNMVFRGLMGIASNTHDSENISSEFKQLKNLFIKLNVTEFNNLDSLSMGMSNDFELAILNGATHIRIGSKIFGNRDYATK